MHCGPGVADGDRVAYLAPNCAEVLVGHFAVPLAGGVLVTLNTRLSPEEIAQIVEHSGAEFLLGRRAAGRTRAGRTLPPSHAAGDHHAADGGRRDRRASPSPPAMTICWPPAATNPWPTRSPTRATAISLNYTSGTTGKPKGVVYTHRGAYLNSLGEVIHQGFVDGSSYLWTLPMFHCNGWCTTWALTAVAGTHVCLRAVKADDIWRSIVT